MRIFTEVEVSIANLPYLLGVVFIVSNFYAAQFSVTH